MRIDSFTLRNFRRFEEAEFNLAPMFNLIIGDNATGKTAILDALTVGLGSLLLNLPFPAKSRSIRHEEVRLRFFVHGDSYTSEPQYPVQVSCTGSVARQSGSWRRELSTSKGHTTRQDLSWIRSVADELNERVSQGVDVVLPVMSYYGTGRLWLPHREKEVDTRSRSSRFTGYDRCLHPASGERQLIEWFKTHEIAAIQRSQTNATLEACRRAILTCIPDATWVYFDVARDELVLRMREDELPFHYLSDGFRNLVAMVADIAVRCATLNPHLEANAATETPGVVLIDEIDLHLHPKWQRRIIADLVAAFPAIQFVATTHSPFVIQSLPTTQGVDLINLDDPSAEDFVGKSIEDITEEVQGVPLPQLSHRRLQMLKVAEEYYECLAQAKKATTEELVQLKQRLDALMLPFSDDPAYQAFLKMQRAAAGFDEEND